MEYTYEIDEFVRDEKLVMQTSEGPFPMETSYEWETVDESTTRMKLRNRGNPSGFFGLMSPLMSFMMRRSNLNDLASLKKCLEDENIENGT